LRIVASRAELPLDRLERERLVVAEAVHVHHPRAPARGLDMPGVGDLPPALRVEGRLLELREHPAVGALRDPQHRVRLGGLVTDEARAEARLPGEAHHVLVLHVHLATGGRGGGRLPAARHLAGLLHQLLEALVVHRQALLGEQLPRHLVGEPVGVVQLEGVLGRDPGGLLLLRAPDEVRQEPLALLQCAPEALLLGARPALDGGPLALQLGVGVAHRLDDALVEQRQERILETQHVPLLHGAAHDAAEDVAALLVRGHDAIGHQEGRAAAVVGEDRQRARGGEVLAVPPPGELLAELDHRAEVLGLEDRGDALEDRRHAVEPHAGVDVLEREVRERAVRLELVLHEDEVPELDHAVGVVAGAVRVGAEVGAAVVVELGARPARTRGAGLPEVVLAPEEDDAVVGDADRAPHLDGLGVGAEPQPLVAAEDGDPDLVRFEAKALRGELPGVLGGALLEVVADREVSEHLEEGEVPLGGADDLDVDGAEGLLAGGQALRRRLLLAPEVGLEGLHAGRREEDRGVV
jgi:hypothetical protein